jgi:hypothetical protein
MLRFHLPLIKPDVQISRIRLSDNTSVCPGWGEMISAANPNNSIAAVVAVYAEVAVVKQTG